MSKSTKRQKDETKEESLLEKIQDDIELLSKPDLSKLLTHVSDQLSKFDKNSIDSQVEKCGFCVAEYGATSSFTSIETYIGATYDSSINKVTTSAFEKRFPIPWSKTLRYSTNEFDFSLYKQSDIKIQWDRKRIPFVHEGPFCHGVTTRVSLHFKACTEMPKNGWFGIILLNASDRFLNASVEDGTLRIGNVIIRDKWNPKIGMLISGYCPPDSWNANKHAEAVFPLTFP